MAKKTPQKKGPEESGPVDGIRYLTSPEEHARVAKSQRDSLFSIADRIESGEPLSNSLERAFAAGVLRAFAKQIPDKEARKPGQSPVVDPGIVAERFALMVNTQGVGKAKAKAMLAEEFGVSDEAIRKALKKYGDYALRLFPVVPNQKKK